jgi:hypothetical protein
MSISSTACINVLAVPVFQKAKQVEFSYGRSILLKVLQLWHAFRVPRDANPKILTSSPARLCREIHITREVGTRT